MEGGRKKWQKDERRERERERRMKLIQGRILFLFILLYGAEGLAR